MSEFLDSIRRVRENEEDEEDKKKKLPSTPSTYVSEFLDDFERTKAIANIYEKAREEATKEYTQSVGGEKDRNKLTDLYKDYSKRSSDAANALDSSNFLKNYFVAQDISNEVGNIGSGFNRFLTKAGDLLESGFQGVRNTVAGIGETAYKASLDADYMFNQTGSQPVLQLSPTALYGIAKQSDKSNITEEQWQLSGATELSKLSVEYPDNENIKKLYNIVKNGNYKGSLATITTLTNNIKNDVRNAKLDEYRLKNVAGAELANERQSLKVDLSYDDFDKYVMNSWKVVGGQLPSVAASLLTGNALGALGWADDVVNAASTTASLSALGASAYGQAFNEARDLGFDYDRSSVYATAVMGAEVGSELIGGEMVNSLLFSHTVSTPAGILAKSITEKAGIKNVWAKGAVMTLLDMNAEGVEEIFADVLEKTFKQVILEDDKAWKDFGESLFQSYFDSLLPTAILGGAGKVATINEVNKYKAYMENAIKSSVSLTEEQKGLMLKSLDQVTKEAKAGITENYVELRKRLGNQLVEADLNNADTLMYAFEVALDDSMSDKEKQEAILKYAEENGGVFNVSQSTTQELKDIATPTEVTYNDLDTITKTLDRFRTNNKAEINIETNINGVQKAVKDYIEKVTNQQVVFVNPEDTKIKYYGFMNDDGNIYISSKLNTKDTLAAVNHEIGHYVKTTNEDLYNKFIQKANITQDKIDNYRNAVNDKLTDDQVREEMFGDYIGQTMSKYKNVEAVEQSITSLWDKLKQAVQDVGSQVLGTEKQGKVTDYNLDVTSYLDADILNDTEFEQEVLNAFKDLRKESDQARKTSKKAEETTKSIFKLVSINSPKEAEELDAKSRIEEKYKQLDKKLVNMKTVKEMIANELGVEYNNPQVDDIYNQLKKYGEIGERIKLSERKNENDRRNNSKTNKNSERKESSVSRGLHNNGLLGKLLGKGKEYTNKQDTKNAIKGINRLGNEDGLQDSKGRKLSKGIISYFKKSAVINKNGELLVLYHGSPNPQFFIFDKEKLGSNGSTIAPMFDFSTIEKFSKSYTEGKGSFYEVYLNIENPYDFKEGGKSFVELQEEADKEGLSFIDYMEKLGYDGVKISDNFWGAFEPNQIKLTTNKNPTTNPDIRFSSRKNSEQGSFSLPKEGTQEYYDLFNAIAPTLDEKEIEEETLRLMGEYDDIGAFDDRTLNRIDRQATKKVFDDFVKTDMGKRVVDSFKDGKLLPLQAQPEDYSEGYKTSDGTPITNEVAKWAKDSALRNSNEVLDAYYHGSPWLFDEFKDTYTHNGKSLGDGYYLTSNKRRAEKSYAYSKGDTVYTFVLNVEKPFNLAAWHRDKQEILRRVPELVEKFDQEGIKEHKSWGKDGYIDEMILYFDEGKEAWQRLAGNPDEEDTIALIKDIAWRNGIDSRDIWKWLGYDGIQVGDEVVIFDSNQAKRLDNPRPTKDSRFAYSSRKSNDNLSWVPKKYQERVEGLTTGEDLSDEMPYLLELAKGWGLYERSNTSIPVNSKKEALQFIKEAEYFGEEALKKQPWKGQKKTETSKNRVLPKPVAQEDIINNQRNEIVKQTSKTETLKATNKGLRKENKELTKQLKKDNHSYTRAVKIKGAKIERLNNANEKKGHEIKRVKATNKVMEATYRGRIQELISESNKMLKTGRETELKMKGQLERAGKKYDKLSQLALDIKYEEQLERKSRADGINFPREYKDLFIGLRNTKMSIQEAYDLTKDIYEESQVINKSIDNSISILSELRKRKVYNKLPNDIKEKIDKYSNIWAGSRQQSDLTLAKRVLNSLTARELREVGVNLTNSVRNQIMSEEGYGWENGKGSKSLQELFNGSKEVAQAFEQELLKLRQEVAEFQARNMLEERAKQLADTIEATQDEVSNELKKKSDTKIKVLKTNRTLANELMTLKTEIQALMGGNGNTKMMVLNDNLQKGEIRKKQAIVEVYRLLSEFMKRSSGINYALNTQRWSPTLEKSLSNKSEFVDTGMVAYDDNGKKVSIKIPRSMMMSLAMHLLNQDNMSHISGAATQITTDDKGNANIEYAKGRGVRIPNETLFRAGKEKDAYDTGVTVRLLEDQVEAIADMLTEEEKAFVKAVGEVFKYTTELINEVSNRIVGYDLATVENYFPIRVWDVGETKGVAMEAPPQESAKAYGDALAYMLNPGWLQERVTSFRPIYLENIAEVLNRTVNNVTNFYGYAEALRDNHIILGSIMPNKTEFVKSIDDLSSSFVNNYKKLTRFIAGQETLKDNQFRSLMAMNTLTFNVGTWLTQPMSFFNTIKYFSGKEFLSAINPANNNLKLNKMIRQYFDDMGIEHGDYDDYQVARAFIAMATPNLDYRALGYKIPELNQLFNKRLQDKLGAHGIEAFDNIAVTAIARMMAYSVSLDPNITFGSEEYFEVLGERLTQVLVETQPEFSQVNRANMFRSGNPLLRMLSLFGTPANQMFNNFMQSTMQVRYEAREGKVSQSSLTNLAKSISGIILSSMLVGLIRALRDAMRDDDDETKFADRWMAQSIIATLGPTLILDDVAQFIMGQTNFGGMNSYDFNTPETTFANGIINLGEKILQLGKEEVSPTRKTKDLIRAIGVLTPIDTKSVVRIVEALMKFMAPDLYKSYSLQTNSTIYKQWLKNSNTDMATFYEAYTATRESVLTEKYGYHKADKAKGIKSNLKECREKALKDVLKDQSEVDKYMEILFGYKK